MERRTATAGIERGALTTGKDRRTAATEVERGTVATDTEGTDRGYVIAGRGCGAATAGRERRAASVGRERGVVTAGGERGSATLWGVTAMALLMAVATITATVGAVRVARHKVYDAADLSALAAARLALADPEGACARAARLARQNGVTLDRCIITDEIADVWTSISISIPGLGPRTVIGRARAGPAQPAPSIPP
ncbi:Rv3654c family TadE-like protein [Nonomuraea sp. NPDC050536]|uniref:Rv3654c family TadE-like protein n=1 Tax=Nonomuraea sp. NPDC050536 TaxID=3364366 RepID=UPI0037C52028